MFDSTTYVERPDASEAAVPSVILNIIARRLEIHEVKTKRQN
jgi:hypothetical protein